MHAPCAGPLDRYEVLMMTVREAEAFSQFL